MSQNIEQSLLLSEGKGKVKVNVDLYSASCEHTCITLKYMARVLKGSHSFTRTPRLQSIN